MSITYVPETPAAEASARPSFITAMAGTDAKTVRLASRTGYLPETLSIAHAVKLSYIPRLQEVSMEGKGKIPLLRIGPSAVEQFVGHLPEVDDETFFLATVGNLPLGGKRHVLNARMIVICIGGFAVAVARLLEVEEREGGLVCQGEILARVTNLLDREWRYGDAEMTDEERIFCAHVLVTRLSLGRSGGGPLVIL